MGDAIGQVVPFGVGVALSPAAIIAVVLMLTTPRGSVNGPLFLVGWMAGLATVGTIVLLGAGGADASTGGAPADWVSVLRILLAALLIVVAARQWRGRPQDGASPELPGWMDRIDTFTPSRSAGVAAALAAVNPKNLVLTVGAAAAIAQTGIGTGDQAAALAVFVLIGALGPGIPVAIYFLGGDRSGPILEDLRGWMSRENATIMAVLCLIIAAKLIGDAISGLAG